MSIALKNQAWPRLAAVQFGLTAGLPPIICGHILAAKFGLVNAFINLCFGCCILFLLGIIATKLALAKKMPTIDYAKIFFGPYGMFICGIAMGISLFGWFTINLNLLSETILQLLPRLNLNVISISPFMINIGLGFFITLIVIKDINYISKFAVLNVPIFLITMGYLLYSCFPLEHIKLYSDNLTITFAGVPLIIAANIAVLVDIPTYYRFSQTANDAFITTFITYLVIIPLITGIGILLGSFANHADSIDFFINSNHLVIQVWGLLFLVVSGIMINNGNIYSCSVVLRPLINFISQTRLIILLGTGGTLLSKFNILTKFEFILDGMAIIISSMFAVMLVNFLFDYPRIKDYPNSLQLKNCAALIIGTLFGFCSFFKIFCITGYAFFDSLIITAVVISFFRVNIYVKFFQKQTR